LHRVLRKLEVSDGRTGVPYNGGHTEIAVVVDVETTGLDPSTDVVIELALRRFRYDGIGRILKLDTCRFWFEDPGRPLDDEIARITGLTDAGLKEQRLDEETASRLLIKSDLVIAHNAAFDRKFIERRLPLAAGLPWACSMCEVDWSQAGFEGRSLGWLGAQAGWFHDAHRASGDVDAVIALLTHTLPGGRTALAELVERSAQPSIRFEAVGAHYSAKDELRRRGYRWNPDRKVWWKDVSTLERFEEEAWLGRTVYGVDCGARASGPLTNELSARERYL
jgi:DNA polymerase-3 subunit epsilon